MRRVRDRVHLGLLLVEGLPNDSIDLIQGSPRVVLFQKSLLALNPELALLANILGLLILGKPLLDLLIGLRQLIATGVVI